MDVDPEFEFECPKWVDFEFEEGDEFEECLDDSWFGRDHPLHEPKDKDENEQPKPLIDVKEHETTSNSTTTATKAASKNKTSKKSIGVKRSVTMQRREGRRMLPDVHKINSKNQENASKCEFNQKRDFTPPSTTDSPLRSEKSNTPLSTLHSPLRGKLDSSPAVNSPKRKLLAKAVNNAINADGQRKRRRLPTIPNESQDASALLPLRAKSASDDSKQPHSFTKTPDQSPYRLEEKPTTLISQQPKQSQNKPGTEDDKSLEEMLKLHNQKVMATRCRYDNNGRRIKTENASNVASSSANNSKDTSASIKDKVIKTTSVKNHVVKETNTDLASKKLIQKENNKKNTLEEVPTISKSSKNTSNKDNGLKLNSIEENQGDEMSVEDLLKLHNKKVTASKCKYDSNGRRIQPGNPAFCPAPSKSEPTTSRTTLSRSKSQSSVQKKTAGKPTINDTKTNPKHHRRSCIAAPSTLTTDTASTLTNNPTDSTVKAVQKKKRRSCIEGLATGSVMAGAAQKSHKQKRRSCFAAPREMTQANSEVDDELKSLIARHNQRLAMLK